MKKTYIAVTMIVLLLVGVWLVVSPKGQDQDIVFGFVAPLSGDITAYGETERIATQIAVDEINKNGGIKGSPIRVVYEDGKCDGKEASSAATKLINIDKVKIILGGLCSGETLSMAPITEQNKVILFSALSSSPDITHAGNYVFRNGPSDEMGGKKLAEYVLKQNQTRITIISESSPFTLGLRDSFVEEIKRSNTGEIVLDEVYTPGTNDFRGVTAKLKEKNIDGIFLNPNGPDNAALLAKIIRESGFSQPLYGNLTYESQEVISAASSAVEGLIYPNAPVLDESKEMNRGLLETYRAYSKSKNPANSYDLGARYDSVKILTQAIEKVGLDTDNIAQYLYELENYSGAVGDYHFDGNGDVVGVPYILLQIKNGKPSRIQ